MYDDFENWESQPEFDCFTCPYFFRQYPARPQLDPPPFFPPSNYGPQPGQQPQHGGMENPQGAGRPPGPPPTASPNKNQGVSLKAVSPGSIKPCTYRYVYIWLENGNSFWAWLTSVDRRTASGFRWDQRRRRWMYFGVDLRSIESFECF
jgi:hypothetical protein